MPDARPLSPPELARYSRQIILEELGVDGQRRLANARVLVIGAGGLGSPASLYLAAAGAGTLGIADHDTVALHNLQRQLLHDDASIGEPKTSSAARRLHATNPYIKVVPHPEITAANASEIFAQYEVIVDGTDNFSARYLNNDAAFFAHRPLVYGSVYKFSGQVSVFDPAREGPCYRCLFPEPPAAGSVPSCGEAGVLGALCGVIGSLQALEAIKLLTGIGEPLRGRLLTYDALPQQFQILTLPRDPSCPLCGATPRIHNLNTSNSTPAAGDPDATPPRLAATPPEGVPLEISITEARELYNSNPEGTAWIDVREPFEWEICRVPNAQLVPLGTIPASAASLDRSKHLLIYCHHGGRSLRATQYLRAHGFPRVTNVAGGIDAWAREIDPAMPRY